MFIRDNEMVFVVLNSDLVNRETFQVEKVNMQNITKNNVEP